MYGGIQKRVYTKVENILKWTPSSFHPALVRMIFFHVIIPVIAVMVAVMGAVMAAILAIVVMLGDMVVMVVVLIVIMGFTGRFITFAFAVFLVFFPFFLKSHFLASSFVILQCMMKDPDKVGRLSRVSKNPHSSRKQN
jgi:hypothetical protein